MAAVLSMGCNHVNKEEQTLCDHLEAYLWDNNVSMLMREVPFVTQIVLQREVASADSTEE